MQPDKPANTTLAFHASRIVIDAGVLLAMASMSLPYVVSDLGDRSGLNADALPTLLLLLPIFAVTLIPDHTRPLHPIAAWASLAFGLAALPYSFVKLLDARILADTLNGSVGIGAYLLVAGTIVTIVGIGIGLYRNLRGLPTGGTPGRSTSIGSRKKLASPPKPWSRGRTQGDSRKAKKSQEKPESSSAKESAVSGDADTPSDKLPAIPQPEIVFADDGAATREAASAAADPNTTAERADAAIDDHIMSMFDAEDEPEPD